MDLSDLSKPLDEEDIKVTMADFEEALQEVKPAFGVSNESLEACRMYGVLEYGGHFDHVMSTLKGLVQQCRSSDKTPLMSCLLNGPPGSGKTAIAATLALESDFFFVRMISPNDLVGYGEPQKCSQIARIFDDAYKSPLSILILDDIERLLEYVAIGPRFRSVAGPARPCLLCPGSLACPARHFLRPMHRTPPSCSNMVLQTLLVLVKKRPPEGRKLMIIGTTSNGEVLESMEMQAAFNVALQVPNLTAEDVIAVLELEEAFSDAEMEEAAEATLDKLGAEVPIKKLLMLIEMARQTDAPKKAGAKPTRRIPLARWKKVLDDLAG